MHVSSNDPNRPTRPDGADGWTRPTRPADRAERASSEHVLPEHDHQPLQAVEDGHADVLTDQEQQVARGKALAVLSHLSILFGVPVFLVPFFQRDDAFALHHAKAAAVTYALFLAAVLLSFATCAIGFPFAMLCYVPALVGLVKASHGEAAGRWGLGELGERVFSGVEVKDESR